MTEGAGPAPGTRAGPAAAPALAPDHRGITGTEVKHHPADGSR